MRAAVAAPPSALDLDASADQPGPSGRDRSHTTDYVVIGSGIGGATKALHALLWHPGATPAS